MEQLKLLGVALGLASLAGVNLYLTVFVSGLAIHYQWIALSPEYQSLAILGHPGVIIVAGILYLLEFLADKIPWVDSAWDAVHTVIRPIGGALLAIQVLGNTQPAYTVIVALLAGGTSLLTHTAKSTTRLASNTSPEPFSNIALSVGEDLAVLGGLALIHYNPVLAFSIVALAILAFLYFAPKIIRLMKARVWLAFRKLNSPALRRGGEPELPVTLPGRLEPVFARENVLKETVAWAAPCLSGRGPGLPANLFGALVATREEPRKVMFLARRGGRPFARTIELLGMKAGHEPKFLSENLLIFPAAGKGGRYTFMFARPDAAKVAKLAGDLQVRISAPIWPLQPEHAEPVTADLES